VGLCNFGFTPLDQQLALHRVQTVHRCESIELFSREFWYTESRDGWLGQGGYLQLCVEDKKLEKELRIQLLSCIPISASV
jgi:hypothetical protein